MDKMDTKVMETLAKVGDKVANMNWKIDKLGEKKEEVNMAQKLDKEANSGELPDTKADTGS